MAKSSIKLGVVMDPIGSVNYKKDSTLAMLFEAQARGYRIYYFEQTDIYLDGPQARGNARELRVEANPQQWYELSAAHDLALGELDVILMRKDPPFDMDYIYSTYILESAEQQGALVVNRPRALREANEKLFTLQFPQCTPPLLVSSQTQLIRQFISEHRDVILKPLGGMGGASIFRVRSDDPNRNVIIETLTRHNRQLIMAQRFIPEISAGDKRILLIDGVAVPYALARIPAADETRGNLAAGGRGEGVELSERDQWICREVGPRLREMGLMFVGLDVIGDYLTEINVTSPTCIRELDAIYNLNISALLMDRIEERLSTRNVVV